jgi:hypothetical protein
VFEDVLVYHFQNPSLSSNPKLPSNVLFDIEEENASHTIERYLSVIPKDSFFHAVSDRRNDGWPEKEWSSIDDIAAALTRDGHRSFHVDGTVGLDGFVFARKMTLRTREARWTLNAEQD